ncbi:MAG TPA: prepilin-type N-terminal cleavage/methylation domain-containing protein [Gallionellaceae bacterium]
MRTVKSTISATHGFTLVELAIVLLIITLLLGGLLPTVSSQIEQQHRNDTRRQLEEIRQALLGYAIMNGRLPCPIDPAITDPANPNYGSAAAACSANPVAEGYLPWKTLGVNETDAWGNRRTTAADPWTGYWRYRVDRNFTGAIILTTGFTCPGGDCLSIVDNAGSSLTNTIERPIAIIYSTGPNLTADGQNGIFESTAGIYQSDAPNPNFDDILIWISRPQLFNRMVTAGKLP